MLANYYNKDKQHDYMSKEGYDVILLDYVRSLNFTGKTVLEIGAGFGRYTNCLTQVAAKVIAVEPNRFMFEQHRKNFERQINVVTMQADLEQLRSMTLPDRIDAVFLFHVLHHLPTGEFENVARLIKKLGSNLFIIEPNHLNPQFLMQVLLTPDMTFKDEKGMFRNNSKKLAELFGEEYHIKRFFTGWLPRGLNNYLAKHMRVLSKYRIFKTQIANPFSAYSVLEIRN